MLRNSIKVKLQQGLTLIELLVVVAITAILATIAVPSYQETIERNQLRDAVASVKGALVAGHSEALKQNTSMFFSVSTGALGAWCYGLNEEACDCEEISTAATDYCAVERLEGTVFSRVNLITGGLIEYEPLRGVASGASTVVLTTDNFSATVSVNQAGRVSVSGP